MKNKIFYFLQTPGRYLKKLIQFTFWVMSTSFLFGCITPTPVANFSPSASSASIKEYKMVYFITPEPGENRDPRNIFPKVVSRLENLGFKVQPVNEENPIIGAQGTGFVIDRNGYILTCAHIFEKEKTATLWIKGKRHEATVINTDKDKDLAILKVNGLQNTTLQSLPIEKSPTFKMGQDVYTIGFPLSDILGNSPRLNKGLISSTVGLKDNPDQLQVSVEIQPGNSGSPLLNENGTVIGLMQSTLSPMNVLARTGGSLPQNVNFAVKTNSIKKFITENNKEITLELRTGEKIDFEKVSESVAQVRTGNVTEDFLKQPKMVCVVAYRSFWDIWYRFRVFHIEFYDLETGELLLKAGQYGDNPLSTEDKVLDKTFEEIRKKFFPS